jgi:hypothetical protein
MTGCIEFPTLSRARRLAHQAHGRTRGSVASATPEPAHAAASHAPAAQHTAAPPPDTRPDAHAAGAPPGGTEPAETARDPGAPPAAILGEPIDEPVDDVDGPLSQRDTGELHRAMLLARMR